MLQHMDAVYLDYQNSAVISSDVDYAAVLIWHDEVYLCV